MTLDNVPFSSHGKHVADCPEESQNTYSTAIKNIVTFFLPFWATRNLFWWHEQMTPNNRNGQRRIFTISRSSFLYSIKKTRSFATCTWCLVNFRSQMAVINITILITHYRWYTTISYVNGYSNDEIRRYRIPNVCGLFLFWQPSVSNLSKSPRDLSVRPNSAVCKSEMVRF